MFSAYLNAAMDVHLRLRCDGGLHSGPAYSGHHLHPTASYFFESG